MPSCRITELEKVNHQDVQTERCRQKVACKKTASVWNWSHQKLTTLHFKDNLCTYYNCLCSKCRRLWTDKYIHTLWVSNGSVKLKVTEISKPNTNSRHITELENVFLTTGISGTKNLNLISYHLFLLCSSGMFIPNSCFFSLYLLQKVYLLTFKIFLSTC